VQRGLVGSPYLMATKYLTNFVNSLPYGIAQYGWDFLSTKTTMCYSSFPGPRKCLSFDGHEFRSFYPFAPTIGDQTNGIIAFSMGKHMTIGFIFDQGYIENPNEFF
jgi:hypothetical protein